MCLGRGGLGWFRCPREALEGMLICWRLELGERGLFLNLFVLFSFACVYLRAEFIYVVSCESGWRWGRQGEELVEGHRGAKLRGCETSKRMRDGRAARLES